jgi:hypothetical protein
MLHITYGFEPDGRATQVSVRVHGEAAGFYRISAPLLARQVQRSIAGDVDRLRRALEAQLAT